ncbi:MAG: hypothetical protein ABR566_06770 [Pyrinomonadaceae bacterium]
MKRQSNFLLSKWYMDCVSDAGDVFIGYAALLQWKALSINYSSILQYQNGKQTESRTSLRKFSPPQIKDCLLNWSSDSLEIKGTWKAISSPIERTIFESDAGDIKWQCLQPLAEADIYIGKERRLKGLGYAEHISISIPPWQLPIEELRWGRFLSDRNSLVWIDWQGPYPLQLVLYDGVQAENAHVSDSEITFDDGRRVLSLEEKQVLREGALINTALSVIPGIGKILPLRSLNTYECKWRSRGFLKEQSRPVSEGWVIHEIVRWV